MQLIKKQTRYVLSKFASDKNGLNNVLELVLDALMVSVRQEFLKNQENNKDNGYRLGRIFGHRRQLDHRVPEIRQSSFRLWF